MFLKTNVKIELKKRVISRKSRTVNPPTPSDFLKFTPLVPIIEMKKNSKFQLITPTRSKVKGF